MDREKFDALARLLGTAGSRRAALGVALSAALFGTGLEVEAGGEDHERRRRRRNNNNNNNNNKKKKKKKRKPKPPPPPAPCFGNESCPFPSPGQDFEACNLAGIEAFNCSGCDFRNANLADTDFNGGNYQGASFRSANLRGADLAFTDVSGASFRDACLVGADFFGANTDGAHFGGAIFCNTINIDGQINNSGCDKVNDCCPPCLEPSDACGEGIFGDCCHGECVNGFCEIECIKDSECSPGEFCCEGICGNQCCFGFQCPQGICDDGRCLECLKTPDCAPGEICCADGSCRECCNDFSDECPQGEICINGRCTTQCTDDGDCTDDPDEDTCCSGICVDTDIDPFNCGGCLEACFTGEFCINGECESLQVSDRALKANLASVDPADMLQRVAALPISTWNYTSDDPSVRHIGPMAQDFAAAFGVGTDDRHIHTIDGQGVALAAIQGLADLAAELRAENARLAERVAALEGEG